MPNYKYKLDKTSEKLNELESGHYGRKYNSLVPEFDPEVGQLHFTHNLLTCKNIDLSVVSVLDEGSVKNLEEFIGDIYRKAIAFEKLTDENKTTTGWMNNAFEQAKRMEKTIQEQKELIDKQQKEKKELEEKYNYEHDMVEVLQDHLQRYDTAMSQAIANNGKRIDDVQQKANKRTNKFRNDLIMRNVYALRNIYFTNVIAFMIWKRLTWKSNWEKKYAKH
tara:strand:- start:10 stop:672 length:663 start_codon:yes stop_codon:yes gene_type:complete